MQKSEKQKRLFGLSTSLLISFLGLAFYQSWHEQHHSSPATANIATNSTATAAATPEMKSVDFSTDESGLSVSSVLIHTTRGKIRFKFYSGLNDAPTTSRRFAELVQQGFYDGLSFHRVEPGFVIQGGDPTGTGIGGSGTLLKAEFNSRKHLPGAVAMARKEDPDSADSQFYISLGTHSQLDGKYTVFGQVVEGLDVVEQIQLGDKMIKMNIE